MIQFHPQIVGVYDAGELAKKRGKHVPKHGQRLNGQAITSFSYINVL
jgi:hypothetical protein